MGWLEIELDDTSLVKMDLNEEEPDVDEGEGEGVNDGNEVDDVLNNEADDEGHLIVPRMRKRIPSLRITKLKLKKTAFNKDGVIPHV
ncbi:unnamed protein product [Lactuca virosa]|uniref:Uncharacterized protein n=1 Tax=Lactuca virosa TaxID=75947 RepID=A0AAU9PSR9_9ASTR|nr:unnamed protein product [Lactuca virosa]